MRLRAIVALITLACWVAMPQAGQEQKQAGQKQKKTSPKALAKSGGDMLTYSLKANPLKLVVSRTPGTQPPRSYQETFIFVVTDPAKVDYAGTAPSCQTFDVEVAPIGKPTPPVWKWSAEQVFCQKVTPVPILAGDYWRKTATWKFTAADVPDGKYRATATFIPTMNATATADFEIGPAAKLQ